MAPDGHRSKLAPEGAEISTTTDSRTAPSPAALSRGGGSVGFVAGPLAGVVTAEAASLLLQIARASGEDGAAAQAKSLHLRALPLGEADADAYAEAVERLARTQGDDADLGRSLERAADVLLEIADTAADVAGLAAFVAERARADLVPDAVAAAVLAEAAAQAASILVEVNLAVSADDERARRARAACEAASSAVQTVHRRP